VPFLNRLWYHKKHRLLGAALAPLSWTYRAGLALARAGAEAQKVGRPVVSVGNLTVGGSGKTPLVIELARMFSERGKRVAIVSRGYRRETRGVLVVHTPGGPVRPVDEAGDEPALLSLRCPDAGVVVGEDRVAACRMAVERFEPDAVLCDDAFQHRRLHRDLDLVAVHAGHGLGNAHLLPRGPLREPRSALRRAGLVVFTHATGGDIAALRGIVPDTVPTAVCAFLPAGLTEGADLRPASPSVAGPVIAACAVAHPEGFFETCRRAGLSVAGTMVFPDHHRFTPADVKAMAALMSKHGAGTVVVTEKDLVRLASMDTPVPFLALRIQAKWVDERSRSQVESILARVC
jgi:tetraacyldisaccharide 4'-kinase